MQSPMSFRRKLVGGSQTAMVLLFVFVLAMLMMRRVTIVPTLPVLTYGENAESEKVEQGTPPSTGHVEDGGDIEDEQLLNLEGEIHITHIFSTFSVPTTSPSYYEMKIVQESWKRAAIRALQDQGLKVEFIDATLPHDTGSSPHFAKHVDLQWWLQDVKKGKVPTVGEPFNIVHQVGRGKLMMFTNADIGVVPEFYSRVWKWFNTDFRTVDAQLNAMQVTAKYVANCFFNLGIFHGRMPSEHYQLCYEDARVYYIHAGGFEAIWKQEDFRLQIALLATKLQRLEHPEEATQKRVTELLTLFAPIKSKTLLAEIGANWREYFITFTPSPPSQDTLDSIPSPLFAGTVTRIDIDVVVNDTIWRGPPQTYKDMMHILPSKGLRHPGNDAFLFHRDNLPRVVKMLGHPVGVRPFGQWLAVAWWNSGHPYRRITATKEHPWTFHVGIGLWGMDSIPWKERANENPVYTLFLAANFDRLSGGGFRKMFAGPPICSNSTVPWRSSRYCNAISNEYCAGMIRFGCYYQFNMNLRDAIWYYESCSTLHEKKNGKVKRPVCDFCNFIFAMKPISQRRFECLEGSMEYCEGLGEGVCP